MLCFDVKGENIRKRCNTICTSHEKALKEYYFEMKNIFESNNGLLLMDFRGNIFDNGNTRNDIVQDSKYLQIVEDLLTSQPLFSCICVDVMRFDLTCTNARD